MRSRLTSASTEDLAGQIPDSLTEKQMALHGMIRSISMNDPSAIRVAMAYMDHMTDQAQQRAELLPPLQRPQAF